MKQYIKAYLTDHETAWAPSTMKSERSRLEANADLLDKKPEAVHKAFVKAETKSYAIKTAFIRFCSLEAWCIERGFIEDAQFKRFMEKHRNRFKHAYVKEDVPFSYEEVLERINQLKDPYRTMAIDMLQTGVRVSEAPLVKDGRVVGKGGKIRKVYGTINKTAPYSSFARQLKSVGLKSHMFRKLCATRLADKDATAADLCKVFGWSSIATSYQYLQPKDDAKLEALLKDK